MDKDAGDTRPFWECGCECHHGGVCEGECCRFCTQCRRRVKTECFATHDAVCPEKESDTKTEKVDTPQTHNRLPILWDSDDR